MAKRARSPRDVYWDDPDNVDALRVWADQLSDEGDPRGEFITLCTLDPPLTPEQVRRYNVLRKKKGEMAGPARAFLRSWKFGGGLVVSAVCEAAQLLAGFEHIRWLNPRIWLTVNAIKKEQLPALAKLPLGVFHTLHLKAQVVDDAWFAKLDFAGVYSLNIDSRKLTEAFIPSLAKLKGINSLILDYTLATQPGVKKKIRKVLPTLERLSGQ